MILNCIIVDDEIMARKSLDRLCAKHENLHVIEICSNAEEALQVLSEKSVDLIFLDIEMPEITGIEFLEKAITLPQIIFTTSNSEYGREALEYHITDYLKKPITMPRFLQAIDKALDIQKQNENYKAAAQEIYIKENNKYIRLPYDQILYFENVGDYVKVVTTDKNYVIYSTMKNIDSKLSHPRFLKVHRSFIINLSKIVDLEESTLVIGKKVIPISRANKSILMSKLNIL